MFLENPLFSAKIYQRPCKLCLFILKLNIQLLLKFSYFRQQIKKNLLQRSWIHTNFVICRYIERYICIYALKGNFNASKIIYYANLRPFDSQKHYISIVIRKQFPPRVHKERSVHINFTLYAFTRAKHHLRFISGQK